MSCFFGGPRRAPRMVLVAVLSLFTSGVARAADPPTEFMPDDSDVVAVVQFGKILKSPAFAKVKTQFPDVETKLDEPMGKKTKITPRQIDNVFVAANTSKKQFVVVMSMTTKVTEADLREEGGEEPTTEKIGDRTLYVNGPGKPSFCLINEKTVAMSEPADTLREILKRNADAEISDELDAAWEDVDDTKPLYVVAALSDLMKQLAAGIPPGFPLPPDTLTKLETGSLTADAGEELAISLAVDCADAATANQIKALADIMVQSQAANPNVPPGGQAALSSYKSTVDDTTVTITTKPGIELFLIGLQGLGGAKQPAAPAPTP